MQKMDRVTVPTVLEQKLFGAEITRAPWTPETVRQDLPDVQVKMRNKTVTAIVTGRKNEYATVRPSICLLYGSAMSWQFSWDAIAHSLNSGNPLIGEAVTRG